LGDDKGLHHAMICPGPHCTTVGTPKLSTFVCDDDGDAINFEVEVVPRGQAFSGKATHSSSLPRLSGRSNDRNNPTRNCGQPTLALTGLTVEQSYSFAVRFSDEFGAAANHGSWTDADGWIHSFPAPLEFDQGPCLTRTCGCLPPGRACEADNQCCSGASDPYTGPMWGFFSGNCR
jgi:hypothetical protein